MGFHEQSEHSKAIHSNKKVEKHWDLWWWWWLWLVHHAQHRDQLVAKSWWISHYQRSLVLRMVNTQSWCQHSNQWLELRAHMLLLSPYSVAAVKECPDHNTFTLYHREVVNGRTYFSHYIAVHTCGCSVVTEMRTECMLPCCRDTWCKQRVR